MGGGGVGGVGGWEAGGGLNPPTGPFGVAMCPRSAMYRSHPFLVRKNHLLIKGTIRQYCLLK